MSALGIWPTFLDEATDTPACRGEDTNKFFPEASNHGEEAKAICRRCPLLDACRQWALNQPQNQVWGVWGGLSDRDRRRWHAARQPRTATPIDDCAICRPYAAKIRHFHHARHAAAPMGVAA